MKHTVIRIALAALAVAAILAAFHLDEPVRTAIVASHPANWHKTADYKFDAATSKYGDWPQLMLAGVAGLIIAACMRSREWVRILAAAMIASTLSGIVANTSRLTTGRTRPRESPAIAQGFYGPYHDGHWLVGDARYNSFPSGHTATAVGFAGVILFARPWIGIGAMLLAFLIAWSRMALGAHHVSDVTVSTILSLVVAWFTWGWIRDHGEATLQKWLRPPKLQP